MEHIVYPGSFLLERVAVLPLSEDMLNPTYASERPLRTQLYNRRNDNLLLRIR